MAVGTNLYTDLLLCTLRLKGRSAGTFDHRIKHFWMDLFLHLMTSISILLISSRFSTFFKPTLLRWSSPGFGRRRQMSIKIQSSSTKFFYFEFRISIDSSNRGIPDCSWWHASSLKETPRSPPCSSAGALFSRARCDSDRSCPIRALLFVYRNVEYRW